jgi:hypothetical protein
MHKIDFALVEWTMLADGAREKFWSDGVRRVRLLELDPRFVEQEWCLKAHTGMVLEGILEVDFHGSVERFSAGQGLTISENDGHKAKAVSPLVKVVFFENI